jgi:hypothetical protein
MSLFIFVENYGIRKETIEWVKPFVINYINRYTAVLFYESHVPDVFRNNFLLYLSTIFPDLKHNL